MGHSGTTYFVLPARTEAVDSAVLHYLVRCSPHGLSRLGQYGHHAMSSACQTGSRAGIGRVARVDGHVPSYLGTPSKGRTLECSLCYVSASGGAVLQTQTDHSAGPILPKRRARYAFLGHEWSLIFSWYVWMEGSRGDAPVPGWGTGLSLTAV